MRTLEIETLRCAVKRSDFPENNVLLITLVGRGKLDKYRLVQTGFEDNIDVCTIPLAERSSSIEISYPNGMASVNIFEVSSTSILLHSAISTASFSTSSTLLLAFPGFLFTPCQISPCLGSAKLTLLNTSSFFSSVPCISKNL